MQVSVGVGNDTVDVEVRPIKTMRSFAVEAKPTIVHRGYQTEKGYQKDIGVSTIKEQVTHKGVNTTPATTFPAATNTEIVKLASAATGTELKIFQAMDRIRNVASNTPVIQKYSFGVNTDVIEEPKVITHDRAIATQKEFTYNKAINTEPPRVSHMGVGNEDVRKKMEPEKPPVKHAAVGIRPNLADKGIGDGAISHSDVYGETVQKEDDEVQHAQETVVQAQKVVTTRATRRYGYNENDNNNLARYGLEREEDRLVTSSSPERTGSSSRYSVETHTTRSYGLGPGRTETTRTTKTYGTGLEPVTKTTEYTTTRKSSSSYGSGDEDVSGGYLARYGRPGGYSKTTTTTTSSSRSTSGGTEEVTTDDDKSDRLGGGYSRTTTTTTTSSRRSPSGAEDVTTDDDKSGSYGYGRTGGGYSRTTTTTISGRSSPGATDGDKSGSYGYDRTGGGYSRTTTTTISSGRGSPGGTGDVRADDRTGSYGQSSITTTTSKSSRGPIGGSSWSSSSSSSRGGTTSSRYEYESESASARVGDGDGGQQVEWVTDPSGNTKMKVIRNVETTYVGNKPVHQSSNVVIQDDGSGEESTGTVRRVLKTEQEMPERDISPGSFRRVTKTSTQESRSEPLSRTVTKEYSSSSSPQHLHGRTTTVTETRIERRSGGGSDRSESPTRDNGKSIKSILKEPGSQSPNIKKKEIKFAEGTVGG